ncbi:hypothetical protein FQA39_LY06496 [Lamprigera yunnana]|nr:hypothetical protein FQA39_LY06496 [Lamprigera yunnana]
MITSLLIFTLFVRQIAAQQLDNGDDIKVLFFRGIRSPENQNLYVPYYPLSEVPLSGRFKVYENENQRVRREVSQDQAERPATDEPQLQSALNSTEDVDDVVRNRRGTVSSKITDNSNVKGIDVSNLNNFEPHENQQRAVRMLLDESNNVFEGLREARGAINDHWIRQPYPVRSLVDDNNNFDDNLPAPSDIRAPRVHFVTQRRLESAPSPVYKMYERQGRSRDMHRDNEMEFARGAPRMPPHMEYYPSERPLKRFEPLPPRGFTPYRDEPYYRYEESRYDPRFGSVESERPRNEFPTRQRRIIYYATLPEVVRTPPNVNFRNRYIYRERYDDRYVTSPSQSGTEENLYRFRKPSTYTKPRYEQEMERTKAAYPLKVSTDVNVRETKKNPERRIYSETDSRYAYKAQPYQSKETFEQRT